MHVNPGLSECFCLTLRSSVVGDERSNQPGIRRIDQKRGLFANLPPKGNGPQPGEAEAAGGFLGYAGGRPGTTHNDQIAGLGSSFSQRTAIRPTSFAARVNSPTGDVKSF